MLAAIRSTLRFHRAPHAFLARVARESGDIGSFQLGRRQAFLVNHPDLIRAVLVDHADGFGRGYLMRRAKRLLGEGLLTSEGCAHRRQRRAIQPTLSRARIQEHAPEITEQVAVWRDRLTLGRPFDLLEEAAALTMEVIARQLFGVELGRDLDRLTRELAILTRWSPLIMLPRMELLERLPFFSRISQALDRLDVIVRSQIDAARRRGGRHIIAHLVGHGGFESDDRLRDEVVTLFMAGHDTTAASLAWTLILLARNRAVAERLRDDQSGRFADAVVRESLRLYPPAVRTGHRALRAMEIGGVSVPAGAMVFVSPYATQRDPRWFSDPDSFRPERWLDQPVPSPLTYFPFGFGRRSCVGEHFARAVLLAAVTKLTVDWRFELVGARLFAVRSFLTLKPARGTRMKPLAWD